MNHDEALTIIYRAPPKILQLGEASAAAVALAAAIKFVQGQGVIGLPMWAPALGIVLGLIGLVTGALALLGGLTLTTTRKLLTWADL